ncbi:TetR/AcrR family transcriptional regulator [Amycolatopsis tolypomycina]|uniref:TetR/AcrR family transcriptional regulator n=1 Tax=Amycolatopsis tolypomycina TaxID=208445 RepID=UPI0033AC3F2F
MAETELPAALRRLWRRPAAPRAGRPAELDVDSVVVAAVELADRDGLAGVTLQKVAQSLGFTKMALYRHVGSKEELFELMADHAAGPVPDLGEPPEWREGVRQWATAVRARYAEHPWLVDVPMAGPPRGPNAIGWMDALLRALRGTGLDLGTQAGVLNVLSGHVRNAAVLSRQYAAVDQAALERDYGRALAELVEPHRFPDAAVLFTAEVFEPAGGDPADHDLTFGLELILDGVAAVIARQ